MSQVKMPPNIEIAIMRVKELSGKRAFTPVASAMPMLESSRAASGVPREFSTPKRTGASPARERLNIMRVVM